MLVLVDFKDKAATVPEEWMRENAGKCHAGLGCFVFVAAGILLIVELRV